MANSCILYRKGLSLGINLKQSVMKKVVSRSSQTVGVSKINNKSIIGVHYGDDNFRYGVMKGTLPGGVVCFRVVGIDLDLTNFCSPYPSKKDLCKRILEMGGGVFLFDNDRELLKWMIGK